MELFSRIHPFVERHDLVPKQGTIIVGFSGGPDSTFLVHYFLALREMREFTLILAHFNHGWRVTADHDEQFCQEMSERYNLPFITKRAADFIAQVPWTGSREEQARLMRRMFFESVATHYDQARVALAHHQDDQDETFFIRLMRGAGLQGLRGMTPRAGLYIRPLLCVRKEEITTYLAERHIPFTIDSTNDDDVYLRNRIRHRVLPALRQCDARFSASLRQALSNLAEADDFCSTLAEHTLQQIAIETEGTQWLDLSAFFRLHPFLQKQLLVKWLCSAKVPFTPSQGLFNEIMRFLRQPQGGKHHVSPAWYLHKQQQRVGVMHR